MKYCLSLLLFLYAAATYAQNRYPYPDSGYLGLGTRTPTALLHLNGGNVKITNPASYPWGAVIDMPTNPGTWAREFSITTKGAGKLFSFGAYVSADALNYAYIGGNTLSETAYATPWMVFSPTGNVGIGTGTTKPETRLVVNGGVTVFSAISSTDPRPPVSAGTIPGEIRGTAKDWYGGDHGFLRLSAGGGSASGVKSYIDLSGYAGTQPDLNQTIVLGTSGQERVRIAQNGNVGIGTNNPGAKLAVNGDVKAKRVKVTTTDWPDYVFHPTYYLPGLLELSDYIEQHKHLPGVPSAVEVKKEGSVDLGDMNEILLKKIEELTLYMIDLKKENIALTDRLKKLEDKP